MELVSVADLEKELAALMKRRGVKSWLETAFDAQDIEWLIKETPLVDAKPVRHGQWGDEPYAWKCNLCQKWLMVEQGTADMNYCPHCGAKMLEESDEEEIRR